MSDPRNETEKPIRIDARYGPENPAIDFAFRVIHEPRPPMKRDGRRITVCRADEIPVGGRRIVQEGALSIGIFNVAGRFFAIKNVCPHQGRPLCQGTIEATHLPSRIQQFQPGMHGRVLRCPWHGWEFDIVTGHALHDADTRVAGYAVEIDPDGNLILIL